MPYRDKEKQKLFQKRWYKKNQKKQVATTAERRRERMEWFDAYKAGLSCSICGDSHPAIIDFHHRNPAEKSWDVNKMAYFAYSVERIMEEIAKCEVWCSNCHRKFHWEKRKAKRQSRGMV